MHRIDTTTAVAQPPAAGPPGNPGYFTSGNPATQTPPTTLDQDWCNDVQENIVQVILGAGISLVKGNFLQLLQAIQKIATGEVMIGTATSATAGTVELTTRADLVSGTDTGKASTADAVAQAAQSGCWSFAVDTGAVDAAAVTLTPAPAQLQAGVEVMFYAAHTNTGAVTLAVNGGPAVAVLFQGAPLTAGQLLAGQIYKLGFDGAQWEMLSPPTVPQTAATSNASAANGPWWSWDPKTGILLQWGNYSGSITSERQITVELPVVFTRADCLLTNNNDPNGNPTGDTNYNKVSLGTSSFTVLAQDQTSDFSDSTGFDWEARGYSAQLPAANLSA